jgi:CRP/FNR family transcriptional regulator
MSQSINSTGRTGDCGGGCYRIEDGPLKVTMVSYSGTERILAFLGRGAIIGELSVIDGLPRSVSVVAVRDTGLSFLSRAAFEALAKSIQSSANRCSGLR